MSEFVRNVLIEQRKRMVAGLMKYVEENVYPKLTPQERKALRDKVLATVNPYHDACLDMVKASTAVDDGTLINEEALRLMAELNRNLQRSTRAPD